MRIIAVTVGLAIALSAPASADECEFHASHFLEQAVEEFDQSAEGWRNLAHRGCYAEVADLISEYLRLHGSSLDARRLSDLHWHEGQMHAYAGAYAPAIEHFRAAFPDGVAPPTSILKRDAVVAFLNRDRAALLSVRAALVGLPEPPEFQEAMDRLRGSVPDENLPRWPLGLEELDNYLRCFDHPYAIAYEGLCEAH